MHISENEIIKQVLKGEKDKFVEIVNKYQVSVLSMVNRMIRNRQDAEDITQEVFLRAYRFLPQFDLTQKFSGWLFTIAKNLCFDFLRKKRIETISLDEKKKEVTDQKPLPNGIYTQKTKEQKIESAVSSLPEIYKIPFLLRHTENYSYEEIAKILELPLGTVKRRLFRAREILKEQLKELI